MAPFVPHPTGEPRVNTATTFAAGSSFGGALAVVDAPVLLADPGATPPLAGTPNLITAPSGSAPGYSKSHTRFFPHSVQTRNPWPQCCSTCCSLMPSVMPPIDRPGTTMP